MFNFKYKYTNYLSESSKILKIHENPFSLQIN